MNEELVQDYIEKRIDDLKPEIKQRFTWQFTDNEDNRLAYTIPQDKYPSLINFCSKVIVKAPDLSYKLMDELIAHEVLHTFYGVAHDEIRERQKIINFFKEHGK